jgi:hypothetical protein
MSLGDNCSIRLSISCATASLGIPPACNFVLTSASESRDICGRTYGRLGPLMLPEVFLSEVDLICFSSLRMGVAPSPSESPRDRWGESVPVAISNIRADRPDQPDLCPLAAGAHL